MKMGIPPREGNEPVTVAPRDRKSGPPAPGAPTAVIRTGAIVGGTTNVSIVRVWRNV